MAPHFYSCRQDLRLRCRTRRALAGARSVVVAYLNRLPSEVLFWFNSLAAALVNATLAAIEVGLSIGHKEQRSLRLGLLISGGMLILGT